MKNVWLSPFNPTATPSWPFTPEWVPHYPLTQGSKPGNFSSSWSKLNRSPCSQVCHPPWLTLWRAPQSEDSTMVTDKWVVSVFMLGYQLHHLWRTLYLIHRREWPRSHTHTGKYLKNALTIFSLRKDTLMEQEGKFSKGVKAEFWGEKNDLLLFLNTEATQIKNGQRTQQISPKKICKGPISIWKDVQHY